MTYFAFLTLFLGTPLMLLALLSFWDQRRALRAPERLRNVSHGWALALHVLIAVLYTTPWDNYLVATRVWWYDPQLVTGITLGWVPLEEYVFFVVQTLVTGAWLLLLVRRARAEGRISAGGPRLRAASTAAAALIWLIAAAVLLRGPSKGTYLALELAWALPPLGLQLAFGADLLWHERRLVALGVLIPTLYLGLADSVAIAAGTWTISPDQSTGILLLDLPLEEWLFFLLTNSLIVFGMTLLMRTESRARATALAAWLRGRRVRLAPRIPSHSDQGEGLR